MDELIERLRERAEFEDKRLLDQTKALGVPEVYSGSQTGALLREAAAALEAAREDATSTATSPAQILIDAIEQEIRQLEGTANWRSQTARIASLRAAIDQARGKGVDA